MASAADREKALDTALAQIDRQFGKGSVMRLGSDERAPVAVIPTGSIALDVALGIGGLPRGRIVEIYGPESSGKTTLTLHAIANAQRAGGIAAFIDAEHALDPEYAQKLGVDIDALLVSQPDTGEQALEIADMLVRSGSIDLVVIDSVAALVPRAEIEGDMGDSHVGLQARLMSQALRKLTGGLSQTNTTMIFINQLREKIGVFFGSPETTAGGKALKFYASVRLDIRRIETLKDGTEAYGNRTRVKVVKNKMAPPFKQAEFDILYGVGISREGSLIDFGVEHEIVRKSGAWYTYDGDQLGQGKDNSRKFLLENPEIAAEIEGKIMLKLGIGVEGKAAKDVADKAAAVERAEANAAKLAASAEKAAKATSAAALKVAKGSAASSAQNGAARAGAGAGAGAQSVAQRADAELLKAVGE
jgi:recombination protein RecA